MSEMIAIDYTVGWGYRVPNDTGGHCHVSKGRCVFCGERYTADVPPRALKSLDALVVVCFECGQPATHFAGPDLGWFCDSCDPPVASQAGAK